ncbi:LacI family transcriptional regulator [Brachybacterium halotolerans subsp. kimchii]|uniref:LacI family DNA-binding transcriptional regulator n=1 Tax=Brachybacterium halotolerans TaxID=2795215 RepID=UPI001E4268E5|nr:LacI family DNA-binding transcriptional regulator [Brachybacterium halotolerans]UEJ81453.1 LacI family transcriptional regulator [Brachybacterium halotolerans subsp. kimchii]
MQPSPYQSQDPGPSPRPASAPARPTSTMDDVARRAGVSRSTVSRVFQPGSSVSDDAKIRVHEAARELGYVPNLVAGGLAGGLTQRTVLGLVVRDATNPAYGLLIGSLQAAAQELGRHLISVSAFPHEYGPEEVVGLRRLVGMRVAGAFVATGVTPPEDIVAANASVPVLVVGRPNDDPRLESISYDEAAHGRMMADRILALGHRRVGLLVAPVLYSRVFELRMRSVRQRLHERGAVVREIDLLPVRTGVAAALDAAASEDLTCIVAPVDYAALELWRAARTRGVRIGEDVHLVGFDGISDGLDLLGLTTIRLPIEAVAHEAVERMVELTDASERGAQDGVDGAGGAARHVLRVGRLMEGSSLGPVG